MWKVLVLFLICSFSLLLLVTGKFFLPVHFRLLGWKKYAPSSLKRRSDGYETLGTSWYWDLFNLLLSSSEGVFFFFLKIESSHKTHLQLWSCIFSQHVTVLFHFYIFFKFLESFAYCVLLRASLRTGFS